MKHTDICSADTLKLSQTYRQPDKERQTPGTREEDKKPMGRKINKHDFKYADQEDKWQSGEKANRQSKNTENQTRRWEDAEIRWRGRRTSVTSKTRTFNRSTRRQRHSQQTIQLNVGHIQAHTQVHGAGISTSRQSSTHTNNSMREKVGTPADKVASVITWRQWTKRDYARDDCTDSVSTVIGSRRGQRLNGRRKECGHILGNINQKI